MQARAHRRRSEVWVGPPCPVPAHGGSRVFMTSGTLVSLPGHDVAHDGGGFPLLVLSNSVALRLERSDITRSALPSGEEQKHSGCDRRRKTTTSTGIAKMPSWVGKCVLSR